MVYFLAFSVKNSEGNFENIIAYSENCIGIEFNLS